MKLQDIEGIKEVHTLVEKAKVAQKKLSVYSQQQVDKIVQAIATACFESSEHLARLAAGETKMGRVESKIAKNRFASKNIYEHLSKLKTTGVINYDKKQNCYEIAQPVGIIAGIIPTTNPTSTTIFKALIALKARNCIIFAPHPKAVHCISETIKIISRAAVSAGAPEGCISGITQVSIAATQELMKHKDISFILATGGPGLVKAAYESGKPAIGVGAGNTPAYIDRSANIKHSVRCIVESQMFDFGTICSSEQSVIVDSMVKDQVLSEFKKNKAYLLNPDEVDKVSRTVIISNRMNPEIVGQPSYRIAQKAGINVPRNTTVLLAPLTGVGKAYPLSKEKLSPVLALYEVSDWQQGCKICNELLNFEGIGHTQVIHATDETVIKAFGIAIPASRILVNSPAAQGGVGFATNLVPSMTLGCGSWGGNISSDNITTRHLYNIKRVAPISKDFQLGTGYTIDEKLSTINFSDFNNTVLDTPLTTNTPMAFERIDAYQPWQICNYPPPNFNRESVETVSFP